MKLRDSRRLTGPNILWQRASAVIDVALEPDEPTTTLIDAWQRHARTILEAIDWSTEELAHRVFASGVSLAISAPIDALYAATEVNEWAFEATVAELKGQPHPALEEAAQRVRQMIAKERNPAVLAMQAAAAEHRVAFLWDDDAISVGMGSGSRCWPSDAIPDPQGVDWRNVHDIPVAMITGTNGKTTTVRLLASMARAAGLEPGVSSTDGCWVAGEEIGEGDYSGPGGARLVLRDPRVDIALLETARGGMLRRGLGVERADVAIITNVAEDHLGEWGVHDLDELVETKFIVEKGTRRLVLNADDPKLSSRPDRRGLRRVWFGCDHDALVVQANVETGDMTTVLEGDELVLHDHGGREVVARLDQVPMTLGGAARHNVYNALGAICVALRLGLPLAAVREGLASFDSSAEENPGRLNRFDLGGVQAIVDFAHNPHGLEALLEMGRALPAKRRLVLVGQAGDREDEAIRELPRMVWKTHPDRVILKELVKNLRGRELGEVPALMADEFLRLGAAEGTLERAANELAAVVQALRWAKPGDLLLLITHEERARVLDYVKQLAQADWRPGDDLPAIDDDSSS
ncbi:MAG: Mur ligase family protein [Acidobacteriota bacterium]